MSVSNVRTVKTNRHGTECAYHRVRWAKKREVLVSEHACGSAAVALQVSMRLRGWIAAAVGRGEDVTQADGVAEGRRLMLLDRQEREAAAAASEQVRPARQARLALPPLEVGELRVLARGLYTKILSRHNLCLRFPDRFANQIKQTERGAGGRE